MTEETKGADIAVQKSTTAEPAAPRALSRFEEMEQMFESMLPSRGWLRPLWARPRFNDMISAFESRFPQIDVFEKEDVIEVRAEIPGMSKDQLDISMMGDLLNIKGQSREEKNVEEKGHYVRREIRSESFERSITLPAAVDAEKASSTFKDGVLQLTLPKLEPVKQRKISIV